MPVPYTMCFSNQILPSEKIIMKFKYQILLSILSGVLLAISFPNANLEPLAFFGLVPLVIAVYYAESVKKAAFICYVAGVAHFGIVTYWLAYVSPWLLLVILYGGVYFLIFGYILKKFFNLPKKGGLTFVLLIPSAWTALEYIRGNILTGLGWSLLGYSQYLTPPVIQIADIVGAYGVSFFIVAVNCTVFILIKERFLKVKEKFANEKKAIIVVSIMAFFVIGYGLLKMNEKLEGPKVKLSVLQGNIPLEWYWSSSPNTYKLIMTNILFFQKKPQRIARNLSFGRKLLCPGSLKKIRIFTMR